MLAEARNTYRNGMFNLHDLYHKGTSVRGIVMAMLGTEHTLHKTVHFTGLLCVGRSLL